MRWGKDRKITEVLKFGQTRIRKSYLIFPKVIGRDKHRWHWLEWGMWEEEVAMRHSRDVMDGTRYSRLIWVPTKWVDREG